MGSGRVASNRRSARLAASGGTEEVSEGIVISQPDRALTVDAEAPAAARDDPVASFVPRLFVLAATVKQACDLTPEDAESLRASRVRLLESAANVSRQELSRLRTTFADLIESSSNVQDVVDLLTVLQNTAGTERDRTLDHMDRLGERLATMHKMVEIGLSRYLQYLRPGDIPKAISTYETEEAMRWSTLPRLSNSSESRESTPACIRTEMRLTPGAPGANSNSNSLKPCKKKRARTGLGSDYATSSDWDGIFDLVGPNLEFNLSTSEKAKVRLTCCTWRRKLDSEQISLTPMGVIQSVRLVTLFPGLMSLDLSSAIGDQLFPADFARLGAAYGKQLTTLSLRHCALEAVHLPFLSRFRCLQRLDLTRCALLTSHSIAALPLLLSPTVTTLSFAYCSHIDDAGLEKFGLAVDKAGAPGDTSEAALSAPARANPRLRGALPNKLSFASAPALTKLSLKELDLSGCHQITCSGIMHLCRSDLAQSLEVFRLRECSLVEEEGVVCIAESMLGLKELDIYGLPAVDDNPLLELYNLKDLERLSVGGDKITGSWLQGINNLTNLKSLCMRGCRNLNEHTFSHSFPGQQDKPILTKLETVDLSYCNEVGRHDTWSTLAGLPALTSLNMSYTATGNNEVKNWVKQMSTLSSLSLEGCANVGDHGLDPFFSHPHLKKLNLRGCGAVGFYAIFALEMAGIEFAT